MNRRAIFLILLMLISAASAVDWQGVPACPSGVTGCIILTGNFSQAEVTSTKLILNTTLELNSSANVTLTNIAILANSATFTASATSGTFHISVNVENTSSTYGLYLDGTLYSTGLPNDGWVNYNYSNWTASHNFVINETPINTAPSAPILTSDLTLNEVNHTPSVTWTIGTDADGDTVTTYIYINGTEETHTTANTTTIGSTVTLTDGQYYNVKARSWDGYEFSNYSSIDIFRMNSKPSIPALSNPTEAQVILFPLVNFSWLNSTDADGDNITYEAKVNGSTISTGIAANNTSTTLPEALHNWSIRAYDGFEYSNWATVQTFRVELHPGYILAPSCTHGATWANCTWTDPPTNFDHLYIVNKTGSNSTWITNVSAGVQFNIFTGLEKGVYNYSTQAVTPGGSINSTVVWLNTTVNDYNFSFLNKTLSDSTIDQSSGTEIITVDIHDNDGNITSATVTLIYYWIVPLTYTMTRTAGETWSYNFRSSNPGAYSVTAFNATDDMGDSKSATSSLSFVVVPVTAGGSNPGESPPDSPAATATATPARAMNESIPEQITLPNLAKDPTGILILQIILVLGMCMLGLFFLKKNVKISTPASGVLMIISASWALGWWN